MKPATYTVTKKKAPSVCREKISSWDKVRGMWKKKKSDSLKHQQKLRQEWK